MEIEKLNIIFGNLYKWQSLLGALIGAAMPVTFWFFTEGRRKKREKKDNLYYIERALVLNTNIVISSYRTINTFINDNLQITIDSLNFAVKEKKYSLDRSFFPLFLSKSIDREMLHLNSGSGYIDNNINQIQHMSEDFSIAISDLGQQFESMTKNNRIMVIKKLNDPDIQSSLYKKNLEDFIFVTRRDILELNCKTFLKIITKTRIASNFYQKIGSLKWKLKFDPRYRFYISNKKYISSRKLVYNKIDKYFEEETEKELSKIISTLVEPKKVELEKE